MSEPFAPEALVALRGYDWPGNIRELANVIEHAAILADGLPIREGDLPQHLFEVSTGNSSRKAVLSLREIEAQAIQAALDRHSGNKTAAANELGISVKTLYNKLGQDLGLRAA
jgi:two-component system NtrC family response regulator